MEELTPQRPQVAQEPFNRFWLIVGGIAAGLTIEMGVTELAGAVVGGEGSRIAMYGMAAIMAIPPGALFLVRRSSRSHPMLSPLTGGLFAGTLLWFLLALLTLV